MNEAAIRAVCAITRRALPGARAVPRMVPDA